MLKHSEKLYKKLPISEKIEGMDTLMKSHKELVKFLNMYHQREEISENAKEIRRSAEKKRAKIESAIKAKKDEQAYLSKAIKKDFIFSQWSESENNHLRFKKNFYLHIPYSIIGQKLKKKNAC